MYTGALPPVNVAATRTDYAGFWLRFVAYIIDRLVVGIPIGCILLAIFIVTGALGAYTRALSNMNGGDPPQNLIGVLGVGFIGIFLGVACVFVIGVWLYYAYCESSSWQGTLGKKALGLIVTDLDGRPITFGRASGRFFGRFVTQLIPLGIGYMLAGFTVKKQALHDMIASCLVLRRI
jgi:uncharacterized RDD family membrane protein YckC